MVANLEGQSESRATHVVPQRFPELVATLPEPSQDDIRSERNFRRATAEFVLQHGGDLAKLFLQHVTELGMVSDSSRFMCQVSPIVRGSYPSPPNWHVDRMPGTVFNLVEHLATPVQGVIACLCSSGRIEATEFLCEGEVHLDEPACGAVHKAGQYLHEDQGVMNWTTSQIGRQLESGSIRKRAVIPNRLYAYDSTFFHKPPRFTHDGGYRMFLRVNTPPTNFPHEIMTDNRILRDDGFYFRCDDDSRWQRLRVPASRGSA